MTTHPLSPLRGGSEMTLRDSFDALLERACRKHVPVLGKRLGDKPSYFLVGDEPTERDLTLSRPFTGQMNEVLVAAMESLGQKYGTSPDDFYITYLVKCRFQEGDITEEEVTKDWLTILQVEYALSGCTNVVCIGAKARLFAGHIQHLPEEYREKKSSAPSWREKVERAWQILRS